MTIEELVKGLSSEVEERNRQYKRYVKKAKAKGQYRVLIRALSKNDRFFLLTQVLRRNDANIQWVLDRCLEVEADPDGYLDIWAREHYKSTIITFAGVIQEVLKDPEITIAIFSFTRPIAKGFLRQIKTELEANALLKWAFDDILWQEPIKDSRKYGFKWSEDGGLVVKRKGNPKESTIEAWGLIDAQPTSKHFKLRVYDDIITEREATSESMRRKATRGWEMSQNLAAKGESEVGRQWHVGTFYHHADTYYAILKKNVLKLRKYPATKDGLPDGEPVLFSKKALEIKRKNMGPYVFATQMLLDPKQERYKGFNEDWLRFWTVPKSLNGFNIVILVDPAGTKSKEADYTSMWVIGLGADRNYYVIDMIRDKLNLTGKTNTLIKLHMKYKPIFVGYEQVALQSDIQHIEYVMELMNYRFHITPLKRGDGLGKKARIDSLVPIFEQGRIILPKSIIHVDWQGNSVDLVREFINSEYVDYPYCEHDDMLDALANINHSDFIVPFPESAVLFGETIYDVDFNDEKEYNLYEV